MTGILSQRRRREGFPSVPRVIIHSGSVIGQDASACGNMKAGNHKIPQLGRVTIEDDVDLGGERDDRPGDARAHDRQAGTKIDNLVQIRPQRHRWGNTPSSWRRSGPESPAATTIGHHVMIGDWTGWQII
jgi:hypothetical protein